MIMNPRLSKFVLTSHVAFSVGWLGAVTVFFVLAITGLTSSNMQLVRSAYLGMELSAWYVIVPFCITSLLTGIVQATGTKWGLFKHYWIVVKLFLTIVSTIVLLLHMQPISYLAGIVSDNSFPNDQESGLRIQLIADSGAAILVLLTITTISIYKPWGKLQFQNKNSSQFKVINDKITTKRSWNFYALLALIVLILIVIIKHLLGGGMPGHG